MDGDLYALLGVDAAATAKEISTAYRLAALRHHPDKNPEPGAVERFQAVSRAYQVLSDEKARAAFDALRLIRVARAQRDAAMAGRRAELRDELLRKEDAERSRMRQAEAERALAVELDRLCRQDGAVGERTCRLKWRSMRPLTEDHIRSLAPGIEYVAGLNKNRTGAEVVFATKVAAESATHLNSPDFKFELHGPGSPEVGAAAVHRRPPFEVYEAETLARLEE